MAPLVTSAADRRTSLAGTDQAAELADRTAVSVAIVKALIADGQDADLCRAYLLHNAMLGEGTLRDRAGPIPETLPAAFADLIPDFFKEVNQAALKLLFTPFGWDAAPEAVAAALDAIGVAAAPAYDPAAPSRILRSVRGEARGGGARFVFEFHPDAAALPLSAAGSALCAPLAPASRGAVAARAVVDFAFFRYVVRETDAPRSLDVAAARALVFSATDVVLAASTFPRTAAATGVPRGPANETGAAAAGIRVDGSAARAESDGSSRRGG